MKLLAYKIDGQPIGVVVKTYPLDSLNGNKGFIFSDTIEDGYEDITSSENIHYYGNLTGKDYLRIREEIRLNSEIDNDPSNWNNLTNSEKDIIINYHLYDSTSKVVYLMGLGKSQIEAQQILVKKYAEHHTKEIESCYSRANSEAISIIIGSYLSLIDAAEFIKTIDQLYTLYTTQGIRGTQDGAAGPGLFDFIESTEGTIYEGAGLEEQGYILNTGTYLEFISALMNVLRNGNY